MADHPQLKAEVAASVAAVIDNPRVDAGPTAVGPITAAVMEEVGPRIDYLTNQEPWWQSRTILGSVLILVSRLVAQFGYTIPEELHGPILDVAIYVFPYLGLSLIAWAQHARLPLFSKWLRK